MVIVISFIADNLSFIVKKKKWVISVSFGYLTVCWIRKTRLFISAIFYCFTFIQGKYKIFWKIVQSLKWRCSKRTSMPKLIQKISSWWFWFERCFLTRMLTMIDYSKDTELIKLALQDTRVCRYIEGQPKTTDVQLKKFGYIKHLWYAHETWKK